MGRITRGIKRKIIQKLGKLPAEEAQKRKEKFVQTLIQELDKRSASLISQKGMFNDRKVVRFLDRLPLSTRIEAVKLIGDGRKNIHASSTIPIFLDILGDAYRIHFREKEKPVLRKDNLLWGDLKKLVLSDGKLAKSAVIERPEIAEKLEGRDMFLKGQARVDSLKKEALEKRADHLLKVYWDAIKKYDFERAYELYYEMRKFRTDVGKHLKIRDPFKDADNIRRRIPVKTNKK